MRAHKNGAMLTVVLDVVSLFLCIDSYCINHIIFSRSGRHGLFPCRSNKYEHQSEIIESHRSCRKWRTRSAFQHVSSYIRGGVDYRCPNDSSALQMGAITSLDNDDDGAILSKKLEGRSTRRLYAFPSENCVDEDIFDMKGTFHEDDQQNDYDSYSSNDSELNNRGCDYDEKTDDTHSVVSPSFDESFYKEWEADSLALNDVNQLTVSQLKQQLRLRGLKVSGRKSLLVSRLLGCTQKKESSKSPTTTPVDVEMVLPEINGTSRRKEIKNLAVERGAKLVDVSAYVEDDSAERTDKYDNEEQEGFEVWGAEAKMVGEVENPVVDNLSRTVITFTGHNKGEVKAYVCASRDALKAYMGGGSAGRNIKTPAQQVNELQTRRDRAERLPGRPEGENDPDHKGFYYVEDYSDYGLISVTGAKISASEVEGILFLSDARGPFSKDSLAMCEKIAFECQPCVVIAPDYFRGVPWKEDKANNDGNSYGQWEKSHSDSRVHFDIRACATVLREKYGVSSVAVFGIGLGGGRALEAASGCYPSIILSDDQVSPPPMVLPSACITWYPIRYDAKLLFGLPRKVPQSPVAIMAVFAGNDTQVGATPRDATELRSLLSIDSNVKDYMVKVFPGEQHGFAHIGSGSGTTFFNGKREVAALLSTAWMETYSRLFLPTVGGKVKDDEEWQELTMRDTAISNRCHVKDEDWAIFDELYSDEMLALEAASER